MEKKYAGKAVIHFYDLREDRDAFEHYRVQVMPTQIFFDKKGKEVYRHLGFMSEADIIKQFDKMGVK
jgi:thioredoxin 1